MSLRSLFAATAATCALGALVAGCSAHQDPPATPVDTARTPTFRSSANSYDQPNSPLYTQPGINRGAPANVPSVAKVDRFDQNAPLALAVYGQLTGQLGAQNVRYITCQSRGATVMLGGTAAGRDVADKAAAIARTTKGVSSVMNQIKVQS